MLHTIQIHTHERGLVFKNGDFDRLLEPGRHWLTGLGLRVERVSTRQARFEHADLEILAKSGALEGSALVLDLADHQRALVWIDDRFERILGLRILSAGVRDIILPGEVRVLLNRVTEAKKAPEANLIARREETAAMRSQANTAKLLESSPTLMKLREFEGLEKVAATSNLQVVLSESGLGERILKLV